MTESSPPINSPAHNVPEYTVSDISSAVKRMVEERFGRVRVRGEISGWKVYGGSGHAYFSLKDDKAVLSGVCWRGNVSGLPFKPEDGLEVIAVGKISTYPGRSSYQIIVDTMEPAGAGALMALLEKRKAALMKEGLFAEARKRELPYLPQTIGVITSPTGAVIRDILHRIADRFPVHVIVWPVTVQGENCASQVSEAIRGFNQLPDTLPKPDILIVARGGGSIEDLWGFNEEVVVRAAADSAIPLISAVGHETDTTLIDLAADRRAPTPTAAAEIAVPVREELRLYISELTNRTGRGLSNGLRQRNERLTGLSRGLPRPDSLLETASQRLDDWSDRLRNALPQRLGQSGERLSALHARLRPGLLLKDMQQHHQRSADLQNRIHVSVIRRLGDKEKELAMLSQLLSSLDYRNVLQRGYAMVKTADGQVITSATTATTKRSLQLMFHDGELSVAPEKSSA